MPFGRRAQQYLAVGHIAPLTFAQPSRARRQAKRIPGRLCPTNPPYHWLLEATNAMNE